MLQSYQKGCLVRFAYEAYAKLVPLQAIQNSLTTWFVDLIRALKPTVVHTHHYAHFGLEYLRVIKQTDPSIRIVMTLHEYMAICRNNGQMVKAGSFKAEDYGQYSLMRNKGSQLAPLGTFAAKVPADLQAKVKAKEKDMLDGKFKVAVVETEPKSTAK